MIRFRIRLTAKDGNLDSLRRLFDDVFSVAVQQMEGFRSCELLRPYAAQVRGELCEATPDHDLEIELVFDTEQQRRAWVASDLHQEVWPRVRELAESVTHLGYDVLSARAVAMGASTAPREGGAV